MGLLAIIYIFIVGLAFGSFALAMVDRMKSGKDWVKGRSQCDHCKHKLATSDLIPLFSWISQKGRCRYCKKKLSAAYPLVELLSGTLFLVSYTLIPYELTGLYIVMFGLWLFALVLMVALTVFDFRWYLLPNKLVYPLIYTAAAHRIISYFANSESITDLLIMTSISVAITAGVFYVLHIISDGKWIGDGDVRLGVAMGLFLPLPALAWMAIFIASIGGLVVSIPALAKSKDKLRLKIPYGPFLMLGLVVSYLIGERVIDWYSSTFLYL